MEFEHPIEQLIHYLIYLFVGETHRLEIDLVIKKYLWLGDLLVPLGKDVVRVLQEAVV